MKRLLAEAGSTKTQWACSGMPLLSGPGLNPSVQSASDLLAALPPALKDLDIDALYFFGAGCSSTEACQRMESALRVHFSHLKQVFVYHDLLAAALACCGNKPGLVGILGTGSNSAAFDGQKVFRSIASPGYVFADEGGGSWLGKRLLLDYMRQDLPLDLHRQLEKEYPEISEAWIVQKTYRESHPNAFLASFVPFLSKHGNHSAYVQGLLAASMEAFFSSHIVRHPEYRSWPLHAVGSIAFVFSSDFWSCAERYGCLKGVVLQRPIDALIRHFSIELEAPPHGHSPENSSH